MIKVKYPPGTLTLYALVTALLSERFAEANDPDQLLAKMTETLGATDLTAFLYTDGESWDGAVKRASSVLAQIRQEHP